MSLSMYSASVPVFRQVLGSLTAILEKAESHADLKKIEPDALLKARLFPDMFPLLRQVQVAADFAKGTVARLGGVEVPRYEDVETDFASLRERIAKTLAFIDSVPRDAIEAGVTARSRSARAPTSASSRAARPICSTTPCRTSTSTRRRRTPSCAITGWRSGRRTLSAVFKQTQTGVRLRFNIQTDISQKSSLTPV
jgi:hypothetical protein